MVLVVQVDFLIPDGPLLKLLMAHVKHGRHVLTMEHPNPPPNLFVSGALNAFSSATFIHFWKSTMMNTGASEFGLKYFPPGTSRHTFVDDFMAEHEGDTKLIEGASSIMGNSPRQWEATYARRRKSRLAGFAATFVAEGAQQDILAENEGNIGRPRKVRCAGGRRGPPSARLATCYGRLCSSKHEEAPEAEEEL